MSKTVCTKCGSEAIVNQRVDSDWHMGAATQVNPDECYEGEDLRRLRNKTMQLAVRVDICLKCRHQFC